MFKRYRIYFSEYFDNCTWRHNVDVKCIGEKRLNKVLSKIDISKCISAQEYLDKINKKLKVLCNGGYQKNIGYPNNELRYQGYEQVGD